MDKLYVVVSIGCLECHNPSELVGVFTDREQALRETGATPAAELDSRDDWRGEGVVALFEAEAVPS